MEVLEFLQQIRTPALDAVNMWMTYLGQEIFAVAIMCGLYWCVNKKVAIKIGFSYFVSGIIVQTMKIIFMIPRPWVLSSSIRPVDEAVKGATGYSFPSGHTQSATALYGNAAWNIKNKALKLIMIFVILMVAFSRMYLGVHSPLDVTTAMFVTIVVVYVVNYIVDNRIIYKVKRETVLSAMLMVPVFMLVYGIIRMRMGTIDISNISDYFKSAGAALGFALAWYFEGTTLNFDETAGSRCEKIIRYVIGLVLLLILKQGMKYVFGCGPAAEFIQYALVVFVAIYLYPLVFGKVMTKRDRTII